VLKNPCVNSESSLKGFFDWAGTQFSVNVYESTGAVWADESIRHQ
jgi:hypothetical protein